MTPANRWQRLRRHLFGKASLLGLLPVIVALLGSAALNISYTRSLATTRALVTHSLRVNTAINDILSTMQDIETGQRGYLITGDEAYLAPYRTARTAIEPGTARLERLVRDNPGQGARIARARTIGQQKLAEVDSTIAAMRTQGFTAAMRGTESALLETRVDAMHRTEQRLFAVILTGIALALAARLAAFLLQLRARRRRRMA